MAALAAGYLIDPRVTRKVYPSLERGNIHAVRAIVVHQTGAASAQSTLDSYRSSANGAHFLVDNDGSMYQTACVTQKTFHVGNVKARCLEVHSCADDDLKHIKSILGGNASYSQRVKALHRHEMLKIFPLRYPTNDDAIGIEVVGAFDTRAGTYERPTRHQLTSVKWLVYELTRLLKIDPKHIYRHPEISYKHPSEAKHVTW